MFVTESSPQNQPGSLRRISGVGADGGADFACVLLQILLL